MYTWRYHVTWHASERSRLRKQLATPRFDLLILSCENGLGRTDHGRGDFSVKEDQYVGCLDPFWVKERRCCCWEAVENRLVHQHLVAGPGGGVTRMFKRFYNDLVTNVGYSTDIHALNERCDMVNSRRDQRYESRVSSGVYLPRRRGTACHPPCTYIYI